MSTCSRAPERYRLIAPDMRGFGDSEPLPMVGQIRGVLQRDRDAGGRAEMESFEGSGHFPPIDAAERWSATFFAFLDSVQ